MVHVTAEPERTHLTDLRTLNTELARLGAEPVMTTAAAELYHPSDLGPVVAATRRHLLAIARSMGEV